MQPKNKMTKMMLAALFAGGLATAGAIGIARADEPAKGSENDGEYVQHLRAVRRALNDNKDLLLKESMSDRAGHRHEAVEAIDKAVEAINTEVKAYDKDMKSGKGG